MNINDQVFIVEQASIHNFAVENSAKILPAKVESIHNKSILVGVKINSTERVLIEVSEEYVYPTVAKALEVIQIILVGKPTDSKKESDES